MKTRRAVLVEAGRFEIQEDTLLPGEGQVLVRMQGCGLCMSELFAWKGIGNRFPHLPGHEAYGIVVEAGPGSAGRVQPGDRVTGLGVRAFADYYVQPESETIVLRPDLPQEAVLGEPCYCVHNVVRAAHPQIGDAVAVLGCGPMGLWAIQALASPALHALVALDLEDDKLERATSFGATHVVNPSKASALDAVREITGGRLADIAIEGTGSAAGVRLAIEVLRPKRPKLVIMSGYKQPVEMDLHALAGKAIELLGAHPGICADKADGLRRTGILIDRGVFRTDPLITHRFRLEEINAAFQALEAHPAGYVKGLVVP